MSAFEGKTDMMHALMSAFDPKWTSGSGLMPCNLTPKSHFGGRKSLM